MTNDSYYSMPCEREASELKQITNDKYRVLSGAAMPPCCLKVLKNKWTRLLARESYNAKTRRASSAREAKRGFLPRSIVFEASHL